MKSLAAAFSFVGLSSLLAPSVFTQDRPMTWGTVPMAQLEMRSFPPDTNASAVILCDYGETYFNDDLDIVHERHCRIKILSPKGYEWGTVSIPIYSKKDLEYLDWVEGCTYFLDSTGTLVKTPLDSKDIFRERTSEDIIRHKFTMPALVPGCVIEYRYSTVGKSLFMVPDWVFQRSEPVLWSEYRVRSPRSIGYAAVTQGYEHFAVSQMRDVTQVFLPPATSYLGTTGIVDCAERRFVVRDARALRDEPFITTLADYANKVDFQLAGYSLVGTGLRKILPTWPSLIEELLDSGTFGDAIDETGDVEDVAEEATKGLTTPEEKMKALYRWVSSSIVWDGTHRSYADQDVDDVLETKRGNSAEINFLLLSLLRSVEIDCHPVILSTRGNGRIQDLYPIVSQFNYVLARATIADKHYYLDATDPLRPVHLLPTKVLNVKGLVIQPDKEEWVTLTSPSKSVEVGIANLNISEDGELRGNIAVQFRDYANVNIRRSLKDKKDLDVAREVLKTDQEAIMIDSVQIEHREDPSKPLNIKAWISSDSYAQKAGDALYLNPNILFRFRENPFKTRERKFPVDYGYGREVSATLNITLPEGFVVKERFSDRAASILDQLRFKRLLEVNGRAVQLFNTLTISATTFPPESYSRLRDLYGLIVSSHSDQLVLQRNATGTPNTKSTR